MSARVYVCEYVYARACNSPVANRFLRLRPYGRDGAHTNARQLFARLRDVCVCVFLCAEERAHAQKTSFSYCIVYIIPLTSFLLQKWVRENTSHSTQTHNTLTHDSCAGRGVMGPTIRVARGTADVLVCVCVCFWCA